jgi:hydrogenase expression/formation protein HypC
MCVGLPMRVERTQGETALVHGRGERRQVRLELVGRCEPGEWLLVFFDAAREKLSVERAREIDAALDLLDAALIGDDARAATSDPGFALPSALTAAELAALTGGRA